MQRIKVAAALKNGPVGKEVDVRGWVRTKRESKQGFAFVELNDGSCDGQPADRRRPVRSRLRASSSNSSRPAAASASSASSRPRRQRSGGRGPRPRAHRLWDGRCREISAAEKRAQLRILARHRPSASADEYVRGHRPRPQRPLRRDPRFLPIARLPLRPHADHHHQRLRRSRADVPGDDARPGAASRRSRRRSTTRRISSASGPRSPSAGSSKPRRSPAPSATVTPSGRRSGPKTRTRPGTCPSSGWSSRRCRFMN